jgi:hypothetical protein
VIRIFGSWLSLVFLAGLMLARPALAAEGRPSAPKEVSPSGSGWIEVPADHRDPGSPRLKLAPDRFGGAASGKKPMILLHGGPGEPLPAGKVLGGSEPGLAPAHRDQGQEREALDPGGTLGVVSCPDRAFAGGRNSCSATGGRQKGATMGLWSDKPKQKTSSARDVAAQDDMHMDPEPPVQAAPASTPRTGYGIADAINLMRSLPQDLQTTDIVVQVIKRTLESAKIDVAAIIVDATHKEDMIEKRIRTLQEEIANHEREIQTRTIEITRLQTDLEETSRVKERLVMAEKLTNAGD